MEIRKRQIQEDFANGTLVLPKAKKPMPVPAVPQPDYASNPDAQSPEDMTPE